MAIAVRISIRQMETTSSTMLKPAVALRRVPEPVALFAKVFLFSEQTRVFIPRNWPKCQFRAVVQPGTVACNRHETWYFLGLSSYIILQRARAGKKCNRLKHIVPLFVSKELILLVTMVNRGRESSFARVFISFWRQAGRRVFSVELSRRDLGECGYCSGNYRRRTERRGGRCVRA